MESEISQVVALLRRYIGGQIALHEVEDVSLPSLWDTDESDTANLQFLGRIHNLIAERSRGDRTEESLRQELAKTIRPFVRVWAFHFVSARSKPELPCPDVNISLDSPKRIGPKGEIVRTGTGSQTKTLDLYLWPEEVPVAS